MLFGVFIVAGVVCAAGAIVTGLTGIGAPMRDGVPDYGNDVLPLFFFVGWIVCMLAALAAVQS